MATVGGLSAAGPFMSYLDEDVSSLDAAARRLAPAEDHHAPPWERLRLLAEAGRFLDEFFQVNGIGLRSSAPAPAPASGRGAGVRLRVARLLVRQGALLARLRPALAGAGTTLCSWGDLDDDARARLAAVFADRLAPVLVPLVNGPGELAAPAANLSLTLAVALRGPGGRRRFGTVEVPPVVHRFVPLGVPGGPGRAASRLAEGVFVPVEQVVRAQLPALFPGWDVTSSTTFRVTRQADVLVAPDVDDLLASVERQLRTVRCAGAVRLEVEPQLDEATLGRLLADQGLGRSDVYPADGLLGMADLAALVRPAREPSGRRPPATGRSSAVRAPVPAPAPEPLSTLDGAERLVHHPYESWAETVGAVLEAAAADPALLAVKQTLYRPTPEDPVMRALLRAAERGSQVVAVVELGARLAERDSVACARALERSGGHVVFGLAGLRTHCPLTLVIRNAGGGVTRYGLVATGAHDPARRPEGLTLLSAEAALTADLVDVFNYLTGYSRPDRFRRLVVGPGHLRPRLLELIRREEAAGSLGRVSLKVHRLVDREIVDALYRAARAGAAVDLVVSGACALRPGVPGLSENIRVTAPGAAHTETSRLFAFGDVEQGSWFLSSADIAPAHLDRHVDVAVSIVDPAQRARLRAILDVLVGTAAWEMGPDGGWRRAGGDPEAGLASLAASARGLPGVRASLLTR